MNGAPSVDSHEPSGPRTRAGVQPGLVRQHQDMIARQREISFQRRHANAECSA